MQTIRLPPGNMGVMFFTMCHEFILHELPTVENALGNRRSVLRVDAQHLRFMYQDTAW